MCPDPDGSGIPGFMPVFERTEGNDRLLDLVNQEARAFGIPAFGAAHPGGCSDASFMAQAGIPILDSVGARGMGPIPPGICHCGNHV